MEKISVRNEEEDEETVEVLMKRIMDHPKYELLTMSHINCYKVALGSIGEDGLKTAQASRQGYLKDSAAEPNPPSELDHFMEEYCMALGKLKEAMEKPIKEAESFINEMYAQLSELNGTNPKTQQL